MRNLRKKTPNINVEVEDREIAIRNSYGDISIIPKHKSNWVKQQIKNGCHTCIDDYVNTLPTISNYKRRQ